MQYLEHACARKLHVIYLATQVSRVHFIVNLLPPGHSAAGKVIGEQMCGGHVQAEAGAHDASWEGIDKMGKKNPSSSFLGDDANIRCPAGCGGLESSRKLCQGEPWVS